nr:hypothetical protein Iba_chr12aCG5740 [Ipomoea batatas]GMD72345.1 hypothetical protein Iba_chr12fCG7720 [Ipomoea batatas]
MDDIDDVGGLRWRLSRLGDRMDGQVAVATTEDASDLQMSGSPERIAPTCGGEP